MGGLDLVFEVFGGDFIERARGYAGESDAQFFGFGQNFLVLEPEFL
jgi:hypothetical protein